MKTYRILDWKKAREKDRRRMTSWWKHDKKIPDRVFTQDTVVKGGIRLPGVSDKDTVFVFAGSTGEVSSRIRGPKIIHSDADARRVRIAKDRYGKRYEGAVVADAIDLPVKNVDWLFSYEAVPVLTRPYFVPRAITSSKKGFIISRRTGFYSFRNLRRFAEMYGIKPREVFRKMRAADLDSGRPLEKFGEKKFGFIIFETNARAKRLAEIDNKVIETVSGIPPGKRPEAIERLRKELGATKTEMRGSFERMNEMTSLRTRGITLDKKALKHLTLPNIEVEY